MSALEFMHGVVAALAWPLVIFSIALILKKPIGQVLLTLTRLRYKDFEVDFSRELRELERQAKAVQVIPKRTGKLSGGPKDPPELLDEAEELVGDFPEPAVAVAWSAIEGALINAVEAVTGSDECRRWSARRNIQVLLEHGVLDPNTADLLNRMQKLRNYAVHERWNAFGGISIDEANDFIGLARGVSARLSSHR